MAYRAAPPGADQDAGTVAALFLEHHGELVRLAERACVPMQQRWAIDPVCREIAVRLEFLSAAEIGDLPSRHIAARRRGALQRALFPDDAEACR